MKKFLIVQKINMCICAVMALTFGVAFIIYAYNFSNFNENTILNLVTDKVCGTIFILLGLIIIVLYLKFSIKSEEQFLLIIGALLMIAGILWICAFAFNILRILIIVYGMFTLAGMRMHIKDVLSKHKYESSPLANNLQTMASAGFCIAIIIASFAKNSNLATIVTMSVLLALAVVGMFIAAFTLKKKKTASEGESSNEDKSDNEIEQK